jgi:FdhE protein
MAKSAVAAGRYTDHRRRTQELQARYPFAGELLDFYGALLVVQERAFEEAALARPAARDLIGYVAEMVVPAVVDVSVEAGPDNLRRLVADRLEGSHPYEFVAAWIRGQDQGLVDRYLARASVSPVLEATGSEVAASCTRLPDGPGAHCPACGGPPQLSYFAIAGEDLASGGRFLLCARCSHSWGFARMTCPGCGEDSSSRLSIFNEEGSLSGERGSVVRGLDGALHGHGRAEYHAVFPHTRIEACDNCLHYLLNIDLMVEPGAVPVVDELAAVPLDLYARERGFEKIVPNLMGF